jgi:hypothetical protein
MGVFVSSTTLVYYDNRSAIQIAHTDVFHEQTKHIEIDCHFVRHHLLQGSLQLHSVMSHDQFADLFIKSHPTGRFRDLVSNLKMVSHSTLSLRGGVRLYVRIVLHGLLIYVRLYVGIVPHGLLMCISVITSLYI